MSTSSHSLPPYLTATLEAQGYAYLRELGDAGICGIKRFNYTWGLVVGIDPIGHGRRYCYEVEKQALDALAEWSGDGHPSGPWIKCKGAGIELLNPAFACELDFPSRAV
jgi:hypothetical protein